MKPFEQQQSGTVGVEGDNGDVTGLNAPANASGM